MKLVPSPNFDERAPGTAVQYVVLHYTAMKSADEALARLTDPAFKVSAHYMIDRDGAVTQLVDEAKRAWHAGVSFWKGQDDINSRSIGIELVNDGSESFPVEQIESLKALLEDICLRYCLKTGFILGHSDVAPGRKSDPGPLFPWGALAEDGFDYYPDILSDKTESFPQKRESRVKQDELMSQATLDHRLRGGDSEKVNTLLSTIGYDCTDCAAALRAFQRRYSPSHIDGVADEETLALLTAVAKTL